MKIAIIDNYDSFTYNLVHYVQLYCDKVEVFRNDNQNLIEELKQFDKIIISPGPGLPQDAGLLIEVIKTYNFKKPILGICLGMQAIAVAMGGSLKQLINPMHGVEEKIDLVEESEIFVGFSSCFSVGRYHSWLVNENDLNNLLKVTCRTMQNEIMAIETLDKLLVGIQFHPESIMTNSGKKLIGNWVNL